MVIEKLRGALTAAWLAVATVVLSGCGGEGESSAVNITRTLAEDGRFKQLSRALSATGLDETLANESQTFTLFAPTDAAFTALGDEVAAALAADANLLRDLLLYHLLFGAELDSAAVLAGAGKRLATASGEDITLALRGSDLYVNDARVTLFDLQATNGMIHALDAVLIPGAPGYAIGTVAEVVAADPRLSTLTSFLDYTGILSVFEDERGSFTLFAPSDAAFAALPPETAQLVAVDPEIMVTVLLNHFTVNQTLDAQTLGSFSGGTLTPESGLPLELTQDEEGLRIGNARLTVTDIPADNGVIHIIDAVLLP